MSGIIFFNVPCDSLKILSISEINTSTGNSRQGGKSRDPVWNYFNATEIPHDSCLSAQSKFCFKPWKCGKPSDLKGHLALKCSLVNREVKLKYLRLIKSDDNIESANKK
ncbi:14918_t:CDS:2 [Entrophospora sp. SA101]|nr:14918_t:CDS:2 [Entrophospora sp. SA101]